MHTINTVSLLFDMMGLFGHHTKYGEHTVSMVATMAAGSPTRLYLCESDPILGRLHSKQPTAHLQVRWIQLTPDLPNQ